MRLNWCLKYSPSLDTKDELKPITVDQYIQQCGADLYLNYMIGRYKELMKANNPAVIASVNQLIYSVLNDKTTKHASSVAHEKYTLWDGFSFETHYAEQTNRTRLYHPSERVVMATYMRVDRKTMKPERYQLSLSQQRYPHICSLEYYYYTTDQDDLDDLGA